MFGSDVSFRMVDFAQRNAERAGVAHAVQLRGGDALQRMPPATAGVMLINPPYGERIEVAGVAGQASSGRGRAPAAPAFGRQAVDEFGQPLAALPSVRGGRETAHSDSGEDMGAFYGQLASHWKKHFAGWTAHLLTPELKLPGKMRLKESRRVPLWNGPIECRLFRFDLVAGSPRKDGATASPAEGV